MMNKIFALAAFLFTGTFAFAQNVGINTTGAAPDNSALLDINALPANCQVSQGCWVKQTCFDFI